MMIPGDSRPNELTGEAVLCLRCGSALPLTAGLRCPFCGVERQIPKTRLQELAHHRSEVAALNAHAMKDGQMAQRWGRHNTSRGATSRFTPVLAALLAGAFLVVPQVAGLLGTTSIAVPLLLALAGTAYAIWCRSSSRKVVPAATVAEDAVKAVCERCGGTAAFAPDQAIGHCRFCGAGMLASADVMARGQQMAQAKARLARLQARRAERQGNVAMARASRWDPGVLGEGARWGLLLLVTAAVKAVFDVITYATTGSSPELLRNLSDDAILAAVLGGAVAVFAFWKHRRLVRWRQAINSTAAQMCGAAVAGTQGATQWLNAFWASAYPVACLWGGSYADSVAGRQDGYPVLLFLNPKGAMKGHRPHAEVLVGADLFGLPDEPAAPAWPYFEQARDLLGKQGFALEASNAGLRAVADPSVARDLLSHPDRLSSLLLAAGCMTSLLRTVRANPSVPLP